MAKLISTVSYKTSPKHKRPGIHAKKKSSHIKSSKNYKKTYKGQGRV